MTDLTQAHLAKLNEMIASGVTKVTHNGRTIEFDSFNSLIARRDFVQSQLNKTRRGKRVYMQHTRGIST